MPSIEFVIARMQDMGKAARRAYLNELIGAVVIDKDVLAWRARLVTAIREAELALWEP